MKVSFTSCSVFEETLVPYVVACAQCNFKLVSREGQTLVFEIVPDDENQGYCIDLYDLNDFFFIMNDSYGISVCDADVKLL